MTKEELKKYIRSSGLTQAEIAKALDMSSQNFSAQINNKSIKLDFYERIKAVIEGETDDAETATYDQASELKALQREVEILRQQNDFLQKMLDRLTEHKG